MNMTSIATGQIQAGTLLSRFTNAVQRQIAPMCIGSQQVIATTPDFLKAAMCICCG